MLARSKSEGRLRTNYGASAGETYGELGNDWDSENYRPLQPTSYSGSALLDAGKYGALNGNLTNGDVHNGSNGGVGGVLNSHNLNLNHHHPSFHLPPSYASSTSSSSNNTVTPMDYTTTSNPLMMNGSSNGSNNSSSSSTSSSTRRPLYASSDLSYNSNANSNHNHNATT